MNFLKLFLEYSNSILFGLPRNDSFQSGLMFYRRCFYYFFSSPRYLRVRQPNATKFCNVIESFLHFIMQV